MQTIIDGQQRLTTITLIYIALYRLAQQLDNQILVNRIHRTYLINELVPEAEKLKLKPTENNKEALGHILNSEDGEEIENRANLIGGRFLKIWKIPEIDIDENKESDEINVFDADDPKFKKLKYAIFFNQKLEVTQTAKLYIEVFKQLFDLQPETFFTSEIGGRISLTKTPDTDGLRQAVSVSDNYFIEANIDNVGKFDRIKQALTIFGFEDELSIKYAD